MLKSMRMRGMKALVLFNMADEVVYMLWAAFFEIFCRVKYLFELKLTEQMFHGNRGRKFLSHERSSESNLVAIGIALFVFERR